MSILPIERRSLLEARNLTGWLDRIRGDVDYLLADVLDRPVDQGADKPLQELSSANWIDVSLAWCVIHDKFEGRDPCFLR